MENEIKNSGVPIAKEFLEFCEAHPELRFWQAIRAFVDAPYVLVAQDKDMMIDEFTEVKDTYYWEGKND